MPDTHNKSNEAQQGVGFLIKSTIYQNPSHGYPPSGQSCFFMSKRQVLPVLANTALLFVFVIFVICVLAFRRGIVGEIAHWLKKPL